MTEKGEQRVRYERFTQSADYGEGEGTVKFMFANAIIPMLVELEKRFTTYEIEQVAKLSSSYSMRLYEFFMQHFDKKLGKGWLEISLDELRFRFGLLPTEYTRMGDFKKGVLDLAIKQINANTDLSSTYTQNKQGRTIVGFKFEFKRKAEHCGIRQIARLEKISCGKVLSILATSLYRSRPKQQHYEQLQVDEFHTFVRNKENKLWLIYAYAPKTKEIVAYVWGKRDFATVKKLQNKLTQLGVSFTTVATDDWKSFKKAFKNHQHLIGKKYTVHIEGNNCALRHLISRATRKSCCFSKVLNNHIKAFDLGIYYLNYRHI